MTAAAGQSTILFISQVYLPDPASVGQHAASAAAELARRGHRVVAVTSARGYDDPSVRYPARETIDGVEVRRVPLASFGKRSLPIRVAGAASFLAQALAIALRLRHLDALVVTTSPPISGLVALVVGWLRPIAVKLWIMDLNPDQAIALGLVRSNSLAVAALETINRRVLARADDVIALDSYMARRIVAKLPSVEPKVSVHPPWPLESVAAPLPHSANRFRSSHGLDGKFVIMYSGNHSPANPIATLLLAAKALEADEGLLFLFVGGGSAMRDVQASNSRNVRSLPYQPLRALRESLSAADVHVVTLGDDMVGIVHPCKVYGAMAVGRPILLFGPTESPVGELLAKEGIGWRVAHGDVQAAVDTILRIRALPQRELEAMGRRAQAAITRRMNPQRLVRDVCDVFERPRARGGEA